MTMVSAIYGKIGCNIDIITDIVNIITYNMDKIQIIRLFELITVSDFFYDNNPELPKECILNFDTYQLKFKEFNNRFTLIT